MVAARRGSDNTVLVLVIALLFVLLFAHAVRSYVRGHDPLAGEVSLLFGAMTGLFVLSVSSDLLQAPPRLLSALSASVLLVLPLLTLRLVSRFRTLPAALLPGAALLYVASTLPVLLADRPLPQWVTWLAVVAFAATELTAAAYFALEGRERAGAARIRLYVGAAATALFAAALLSIPFGVDLLPQVLALLSGVGYVAAFMPPRAIRSFSAMAAAHLYGRELLSGRGQPSAQQVWQRFAAAVDELTESDAVVVLARADGGKTRTVAASGIDLDTGAVRDSVDFEMLSRLSRQRRINADCPVESALARTVDARYATLVPLRPPYSGTPEHVAMLLSQHRSLFSGDDLEVIRDLGAQATLLAGRADASNEQRRLAGELVETVDALHRASKAKSDLLARVSHEFRTPLTAIIGYSALLRRGLDGGDPMLARTGPDRIHSAGVHLLALVEEVLDLAQMDAGRFDLQIEPVELADLVARTIDELRPLAARKQLTVQSEVPAGTVSVDANRMRQVLYNLLSNAIKFTPSGGNVRVLAELDEFQVRVSVVDDGIGIPLEDQPRIFEEFTQVAEHGPHEGTGLGLSIVRRLVVAHGGHTELESTPGEGSRFVVTLPRQAVDQASVGLSAGEPGV